MIEKLLRDKSIRVTKNRLAILELLMGSNPMTAEEIYDALRKDNFSLSSIYRNLAFLTDKKILIKTLGMDNVSYYQINSSDHKHQLQCQVCKKVIPIDFCPVHEIQDKIEKTTNFKITGHSFEFVGICPDCQKKEK